MRRYAASVALVVLLLVALLLRTYSLDWDRGYYFHPDERQILMVASELSWPRDPRLLLSPSSPLNPHFFAYGSFPIYLLRVTSELAARSDWGWALTNHATLLGRLLSALFDTLTVLVTYLLGRKVLGQRVGVLAALCVTFTVLHIQLAHFYTVDTLLTTLILLTVSKAVDVARSGRRRDGIWLGILLGIALATKVSVLPLIVVALVAWLAYGWTAPTLGSPVQAAGCSRDGTQSGDRPALRRTLHSPLSTLRSLLSTLDPRPALRTAWGLARRGILLTFGVAALCFALLEPYALIDAVSFVVGIGQEIGMAQGWWDLPYTRQYAYSWPYLYQVRQILLFALGLPLGLLALGGLLWLCWRVLRQPSREKAVFLTWPVLYALVQGTTYAKFIRYMLPLSPFLCLAGAALWVSVWDAAGHGGAVAASGVSPDVRSGHVSTPYPLFGVGAPQLGWSEPWARRFRWLWLALLLVVVASTVFYALAFLNVYRQPHPWLQATAWLCKHVPSGSTILAEYWDDPLPLKGATEAGGCPLSYTLVIMDFHTLDTDDRLEELLDDIQSSDYIVLSSQRLYASLVRNPEYFPLATRYYQQLFAERLGFRLVAAPAVYPQLADITLLDDPRAGLPLSTPPLLAASRPAGWVIDLGQADESFTVYDHPQPLIFARVEHLPREELQSLIVLKSTDKP